MILGGVVGLVREVVVVVGVIGGEVGQHDRKCWGLGEDLFEHGRQCREYKGTGGKRDENSRARARTTEEEET